MLTNRERGKDAIAQSVIRIDLKELGLCTLREGTKNFVLGQDKVIEGERLIAAV